MCQHSCASWCLSTGIHPMHCQAVTRQQLQYQMHCWLTCWLLCTDVKPYAARLNQQDTRVLMPAGDSSIPLGTANTRAAAAPVGSTASSTAG